MQFEIIENNNIRYAEIIRSSLTVEKTKFFSPPSSSFQFGLLAHRAGFTELPHSHKRIDKSIKDLQQMFVVQKGKVLVRFFSPSLILFSEVELLPGDAILLVDGIHSIHMLEDSQCVSVKQGPFLGDENDKVIMETL